MRAADLLRLLTATALICLASPSWSVSTNARPCDNGAAPPTDPSAADYDERLIGVCQLDNTVTTFEQQPKETVLGDIPFTVRSCSPDGTSNSCDFATPYAVSFSGPTANGNKFVLEGTTGDQIAVALSFSSGGISDAPKPGQFSGLFPGGANGQQVPATINVALQNQGNRTDTFYSGTFSLAINQCEGGKRNTFPCDGSTRTTEIPQGTITFTINLIIGPAIQISGLEDMALVPDGAGAYVNSQDFCVYTTSGALYRITADSQNGSGNFLLQGTTQSLQYEAAVSALGGNSEALQEAVISSNTWQGHPQPDCNGYAEENMRIDIRVPPAEIGNATETSYSDTLTLTVEVE